jgi:hypothetical protein
VKTTKKRTQKPQATPRKPKELKPKTETNIIVIPDAHLRPGDDLTRADYVAAFLAEHKGHVTDVVCIGDNHDLSSLCMHESPVVRASALYDYKHDVAVGQEFHDRCFSKVGPDIRRYYHLGNHEARISRFTAENPEFRSLMGMSDLSLSTWFGDNVIPYEGSTPGTNLIAGITFCHFAAYGPMSRAISSVNLGHTLLQKLHTSTVVGHAHLLSYATTVAGRRRLHGLSVGAYTDPDRNPPFNYAGVQERQWWNGLVYLEGCEDGDWKSAHFITLRELRKNYG